MEKGNRGELKIGESHPAAHSALMKIRGLNYADLAVWLEAFSSCAIAGNRLAEICSETLYRFLKGKPVGDRYILGLAWTIFNSEFDQRKLKKLKTKRKKIEDSFN